MLAHLADKVRERFIAGLQDGRGRVGSVWARATTTAWKGRATGWSYLYRFQYTLSMWRTRHGLYMVIAVLALLAALNVYSLPRIQVFLQSEAEDVALEPLRNLLLNLGSPLIGAAAIVSSLVMFAMQINIERMPHGLFRRLSSDMRILGAFALSFALAIGVACMSLVIEKARFAPIASAAVWAVVLTLLLFLYAYRRALILVNPIQQLRIVLDDAQWELAAWGRRAQRARPLIRVPEGAAPENETSEQTDFAAATYFRLNPHWTDGAQRAIRHAISFVRRYSEAGDYEVSGAGLNVVIAINQAYIETKGRTFFASNAVFESPLTTDAFLNDTLEHLRQLARESVARSDEQQIEQTLRALAVLSNAYLEIAYGRPHAHKTHAQLAAGYLAEAVKSVIPANMPDVLMEGVRLMGSTARGFLLHGRPTEVVSLAENVAMLGLTGAVKQTYRPVTLAAMEQLANITFDLLRLQDREVRYALGQVREDVTAIVHQFMAVPDTPLMSTHSTYLAPYYSSTSQTSLRQRLSQLVNALGDRAADDKQARAVLTNIAEWSEKLPAAEKPLLIAAVKGQSHFVFDILHWITGVFEVLLAASNAPACAEHTRKELRGQATKLLYLLSWVPTDKDTVNFIENYRLSDLLFEAAADALQRDCHAVSEVAFKLLVSWAFKAGKERTGWATLEHGLLASGVLVALENETWRPLLNALVLQHLGSEDAPNRETRDAAARDLRENAETVHPRDYATSELEAAIGAVDRKLLQSVLHEVANTLSPDTADEPIRHPGML